MLHNALDCAVKERLIVRNPADDCIPLKNPKHEMKILPPEQIKSYLTAAEQRGVLPMFYLELISGLRKGELVALQWSDLDIENKTISVGKQAGRNNAGEPDITRPKTENSIRKISIPQEAVDLLVAEHQKYPNMLGHFDAGFTLRTYTHVTRRMQESAAEKMGNFMAQVM